MSELPVDMSRVDWDLLREQKWQLYCGLGDLESVEDGEPSDFAQAIEGIIHLLDYIQDTAAEVLGEDLVFGKDNEENDDDDSN